MRQKLELLPCPFCGSKADLHTSTDAQWEWIRCSGCNIRTEQFFKFGDALKQWNNRAQHSKGMVEKEACCNNSSGNPVIAPSCIPTPKEGSSVPRATVADVIMTYENTKWYRGECCSGYPNCIHKPLLASEAKLSAKPELVALEYRAVWDLLFKNRLPNSSTTAQEMAELICSTFGTPPSRVKEKT